jgi:hypothetical protein
VAAKRKKESRKILCIFKNHFYLCHHKSNIPSFKGVWFLLRRAKRLGSAKPWQPILKYRRTVPKPNPGKPGDDKNLTRIP